MKYRLFSLLLSLLVSRPAVLFADSYIRVDNDYVTAALFTAGYGAQYYQENNCVSDFSNILTSYENAAGYSVSIFASKLATREALKAAGLFDGQENYYYQHIYYTVESHIIPRLYHLGKMFLQSPEKILYWGPEIYNTCERVKDLCKQFELVVTNGQLSFSGIRFLEVNPQLAQIFNLARSGGHDWKAFFDRLCDIPEITKEDLKEDLKELIARLGARVANLPAAGAGSASGRASGILTQLGETLPTSIGEARQRFESLYGSLTDGSAIRQFMEGVLGDLRDSLAVDQLFQVSSYDVSSMISNYLRAAVDGTYYVQYWYIYHNDPTTGYQVIDEEKLFDSRTMDLSSFRRQLEAQRELLERESGEQRAGSIQDIRNTIAGAAGSQTSAMGTTVRYYLASRDPQPYQITPASAVHQVSRATFTVRCQQVDTLAQGGYSFLVNPRYNHSHFHYYLMGDPAYDRPVASVEQERQLARDSLTNMKEATQASLSTHQQELQTAREELLRLESAAYADGLSSAERSRRMALVAAQRQLINTLNYTVLTEGARVDELSRAIAALDADYVHDTDAPYRILYVMQSQGQSLHIRWTDEGQWYGDTFVRHGVQTDTNLEITFTADGSKDSDEEYVLGVRIHRAQCSFYWRITTGHEMEQVVDILEFGDGWSDADKAARIDMRRSEIQNTYPACQVTVDLFNPAQPSQESQGEAIHLLWASDRLAFARDVDYRISMIDKKLAFLEHYVYTQQDVLGDFLSGFLRRVHRTTPSSSIYTNAFNVWLANSRHY